MRVAVVSGASRGLGAALVEGLLERGERVVGLARSFPARLADVAEAYPDRLRLRTCDLAVPGGLPTAHEFAPLLAGASHLTLINNAATVEPLGAVGALAGTAVHAAVAVNLTAAMVLTNEFLAAVRDPSVSAELAAVPRPEVVGLRVIYVSSSVASRAKAGNSVYGATKAGGELFFTTLQRELEHDPRVRVEIVDPGGMDTEMHRTIRTRTDVYLPDQDRMRRVAESGALAKPATVARRILDTVTNVPITNSRA